MQQTYLQFCLDLCIYILLIEFLFDLSFKNFTYMDVVILVFSLEEQREWRAERSGLMKANKEFVEEVSVHVMMSSVTFRYNLKSMNLLSNTKTKFCIFLI